MSSLLQFDEIPRSAPDTPLLDSIASPKDLKPLSQSQLIELGNELRAFLLYSVGQTGGHFGAGLGVIELTIALHHCFNAPTDHLVWDVGHQCYPHKILTGRRDEMDTLRKKDGIAPFPKRAESPFDTFGVGHSSTSVSAALGMAIADQLQEIDSTSIAIIGDGAMSAGMAFEALNHAAEEDCDLIVVFNDNDMSISHSTGGLSKHLTQFLSSEAYHSSREVGKQLLSGLPRTRKIVQRTEEIAKGMISAKPSILFEALGFSYSGPINGHDIPKLISTLEIARKKKGPQFIHVLTQKGKGLTPAENDPIGFHAISKLPSLNTNAAPKPSTPKYANIFGQWLYEKGIADSRAIGITPAMCEGSDLIQFSKAFPDRYFDVAIAEQHAVTLAAGIATRQLKPVVAIYSTFLQRGYDQLIHDVALQDLDVLFAIDRAGLVGEDGPTHAGSFDIAYLRCIPNMLVMTPSDELETRKLLETGYQYAGPASVRYPRGTGPGNLPELNSFEVQEIGKSLCRRTSKANLHILCFGTLLKNACLAADTLDANLHDMRFVKPIDAELLQAIAINPNSTIVTLEEGCLQGGAGSAVMEALQNMGYFGLPVLQLALPDTFIQHATHAEMLEEAGLDEESVLKRIQDFLASLNH